MSWARRALRSAFCSVLGLKRTCPLRDHSWSRCPFPSGLPAPTAPPLGSSMCPPCPTHCGLRWRTKLRVHWLVYRGNGWLPCRQEQEVATWPLSARCPASRPHFCRTAEGSPCPPQPSRHNNRIRHEPPAGRWPGQSPNPEPVLNGKPLVTKVTRQHIQKRAVNSTTGRKHPLMPIR